MSAFPHVFANLPGPVPLQYLDDNFNAVLSGAGGQAASIANLRNASKSGPGVIFVVGYRTAGDGGQGYFHYVASDTTSADDGGLIIVAADGSRWYRFYSGPINAAMFGYVADANPTTGVSVGGFGVSNVTAINNMLASIWKSANAPGYNAGLGGYGGKGMIPPGYGEIAGPVPIVINPANLLDADGEYISVLCGPTFKPTVTQVDGSVLDLGAVYFDVTGAPYSNVPGYPTGIQNVALLGFNTMASAIVVNSNTARVKAWIGGWGNSGIVLANTNTDVDAVVEQCGTNLTFAPFSNGNRVRLLSNATFTGVTVNNRKWYTVAASGNTGGTTPAVVIAALQGLVTGYAFNGNVIPAANFTGYQVTVKAGTGVGQTGHVTASVMNAGTWTFTLTLASDSGSWTALDSTSQVVIFNASLENTLTLMSETISFCCLNVNEAYGLLVDNLVMSSSTTIPSNGAVFVKHSEDIDFVSINAKAALDYRKASTTANGIIVDASNKNIKFRGGIVSGWANGLIQGTGNFTDGLTVCGMSFTGNSNTGAAILDGIRADIYGNDFSNNGSSGTPGTGLKVVQPTVGSSITIGENSADGLVGGVAGFQATGFDITSSTSSSVINMWGNTPVNNSTAQYAFAGHTEVIFTDPSVSRTPQTVANAATITIPLSACADGTIKISGTGTITGITVGAAYTGAKVTILTPSGTASFSNSGTFHPAGSTTLNMTGGSSMTMVCDGTVWTEMARAIR